LFNVDFTVHNLTWLCLQLEYKADDSMQAAAIDLVWGNDLELDKPANLTGICIKSI